MNFHVQYIYEAVDKFSGKARKIKQSVKAIGDKFDALKKKVKAVGSSIQSIGAKMSMASVATGAYLASSIKGWDQQAKAVALVETGIKSTGGVAGKTIGDLKSMASKLQAETLFGDEDILANATSQLLTFTKITGPVFDRAQESVLDMATKIAGASGETVDLRSSSIMLGKALNDPIKGLSALSRVGITFSKQQEDQIKGFAKSGQLAKAQAVMLDELETQFGGTAKAAALAGAGGLKQMSNAIGDFNEGIGQAAFELLRPFIKWIKELAEKFSKASPATKKMVAIVALLITVLGPVLIALGAIVMIAPAIATAFTVMMGPVGLITVAIAALVAGIIWLVSNWDMVKKAFMDSSPFKIMLGVFDSITDGISYVISLINKLMGVWDKAKGFFSGIGGAIGSMMGMGGDVNVNKNQQVGLNGEIKLSGNTGAVESAGMKTTGAPGNVGVNMVGA